MSLKNVVCLALLFAMMFSLSACTDYEGVVDDKYEEWKASIDDIPNSSFKVVLSSSSSVTLSDSEGSSSSFKASWTYLNPDIGYGEITDTRDNQVYKTVTIGTQTWMAENLNYNTKNSWCYDNKASNCDKYGRLYTWSAVMDSVAQFSVNAGTKCGYGKTCTPNSPHRGICPEGWHVPTNEEYSTLYTYIGGSSTAGSMLKSASGWNGSGNGTDKYGVSVLPAGYRGYGGDFGDEGGSAYLWSASDDFSSDAWYQDFHYYYYGVDQSSNGKYYGRSLRCLKDSSPTSGAATSSSSQAQPSSSSFVSSSSSSNVIPDPESSSSIASSSSAKSSSSVASSSSVKSSSSVASSSSLSSSSQALLTSSSAKSSSSIASSSSVKSSSSVASSSSLKAAWTYLNPSISYGEIVDSRDNQVYKTVTIGTQTWMAQNLNYAYTGVKYNHGSYSSDSTSWCYDNKASNCDKYGRLYTWSAVMDSAAQFSVNAGTKCGYDKTCSPNSPHRGICPEGWHVPTNEEYSILYTYIGGTSTAGSLLKSTSGWYNSGNVSDKYGFSLLPAGSRLNDGSFNGEGNDAGLWSASEYNSDNAWSQDFNYRGDYAGPDFNYSDDYTGPDFNYNEDCAGQDYYYKGNGKSLRCLKDND